MGADAVAAALEQLAGLTSGSAVSRSGALARSVSLVRRLDPDDKRELAARVAERVAPSLVPRIRAQTGVDLTAEQVDSLLDLVRRLDHDDLTSIAADVRAEALGTAGDGAADAAPERGAGGGAAAEDAGGDAPGELGDVDRGSLRRIVARMRDEAADAAVTLASARADAERHAREAAALTRERDAAVAARRDLEQELRDTTAALRATEQRVQELERGQRRLERELEARRAELDQATELARRQADLAGAATGRAAAAVEGRGARDRGAAGPVGGVAPLPVDVVLDRQRRASSGREHLALLEAAAGPLRGVEPARRRDVVAAVPDGWARRRAIGGLVDAAVCDGAEALALTALLGRDGDRRLAVGDLVARGLVSVEDASGVLDARAVARLRRRAS